VYSATPGQFTPEAYKQTYVQGLQQLLGLLDKQHTPVERIIFVSSTSVYGQEQGEIVTEESETAPKGFSGQTMLEAEANLSKHAIPSTIVRFGGIYGPTRSLSLLQKVKRGEASLQPDPSRMTNRIHQDDCVGILAHLLHHPQPASLYLGVDSTPVSYNEVISWMAQELDAPPPTLITPARPSRRQPTNKQCCNQRIREDGYQFSFPSFREGYREIITKHHPTSPQTDA
jgi:nucleoside-diphosphate-sugar epimerase